MMGGKDVILLVNAGKLKSINNNSSLLRSVQITPYVEAGLLLTGKKCIEI
jgi:hypothetical protein